MNWSKALVFSLLLLTGVFAAAVFAEEVQPQATAVTNTGTTAGYDSNYGQAPGQPNYPQQPQGEGQGYSQPAYPQNPQETRRQYPGGQGDYSTSSTGGGEFRKMETQPQQFGGPVRMGGFMGPMDIPVEDIVMGKIGEYLEQNYNVEDFAGKCQNQQEIVDFLHNYLQTGGGITEELCGPMSEGLEKCGEAKKMCEQVKQFNGPGMTGPGGEIQTCPPDKEKMASQCLERYKSEYETRKEEESGRAELDCEREWQFNSGNIQMNCPSAANQQQYQQPQQYPGQQYPQQQPGQPGQQYPQQQYPQPPQQGYPTPQPYQQQPTPVPCPQFVDKPPAWYSDCMRSGYSEKVTDSNGCIVDVQCKQGQVPASPNASAPSGGPVCAAGQKTCDGNKLRECDPSGQWNMVTDCLYGCENGQCRPATSTQPTTYPSASPVASSTPAPAGCQYGNPPCPQGQNCENNQCITPNGCQYNNPACGPDQDCVNNQCQPKAGCQYNNPACSPDQVCTNNQCAPAATPTPEANLSNAPALVRRAITGWIIAPPAAEQYQREQAMPQPQQPMQPQYQQQYQQPQQYAPGTGPGQGGNYVMQNGPQNQPMPSGGGGQQNCPWNICDRNAFCSHDTFLQKCVEGRSAQMGSAQGVDFNKLCELESKFNLKSMERFCKDQSRGYEDCISQTSKQCEYMQQQLAKCKEMTDSARLKELLAKIVGKFCKMAPLKSRIKVEQKDIGDFSSAEIVPVVAATKDGISAEEEQKLKSVAESVDGYVSVSGLRLYSVKVRASRFNELKSLPFVQDAKLDHVRRAMESGGGAGQPAGPQQTQRLDDAISTLEASKDLLDSDLAPWVSAEQDRLMGVSSELQTIDNESKKKDAFYQVQWFLGMQAEREKNDAARIAEQKSKLEKSIASLEQVAGQVEDVAVRSQLEEQVKDLKAQLAEMDKSSKEKDKYASGLVDLIAHLFG